MLGINSSWSALPLHNQSKKTSESDFLFIEWGDSTYLTPSYRGLFVVCHMLFPTSAEWKLKRIDNTQIRLELPNFPKWPKQTCPNLNSKRRSEQHCSMAPGDQHRTSSMRSTIVFSLSVGAVIILGMLAVALTVTWIVKYFGGFAWDGTAREFNYHPLCMVISMVFLYSEGKFLCSLTEALLPLCLLSVDYIM